MDKAVVFLFRPGKAGRRRTHHFDFGPARQGLLRRLLHPLARRSQGIDWESAHVKSLLPTLYPSTIVRCLMQAQIAARHAPEGFSAHCSSDTDVRNSIVIVPKQMILRQGLLHRLKKRGNRLLLDLIDGFFEPESLAGADGLLCCSRKALAHYAAGRGLPPVFFVEHCADVRLPRNIRGPAEFSPYYFGAPQNLFLPASLRRQVTPVFTDQDNVADPEWFRSLPLANLHYAVRPPDAGPAFKPFIKGITAALCGANILVHKDDGDAALYLGEDYPYLIREECGEKVVADYLRKAREDFGGRDWNRGLSAMRRIRELAEEKTIADQFWAAVAAVA
jgi:hypothetical protein